MKQVSITAAVRGRTGSGATAGVVLLHALGRTRWSMWLLARRLRAAGWLVAEIGYPSRRLALAASSALVAERIAEISRDWQAVHLVGHSLGGLIARHLAATRLDLRIGRVLQLGSPNLGTPVAGLLLRWHPARWVLGPALSDVAAFPPRAQRMGSVGAIAGIRNCGWFSARLGLDGPGDGLVTVRSAWGGAGERAAVAASHTFLPFNAHAARLVSAFLRDGSFNAAREGDR